MKLEYIEPEIEITLFSIEDIICDSGTSTENPNDPNDPNDPDDPNEPDEPEEPEEAGIEIDATSTAPVFSYSNFL